MLTLLVSVGYTQSFSSYYYYKGQQVSISLSEKIMFVKFIPGITNNQKQGLITQAQVDLQNTDWNNIPDLVQLKSRILQQLIWVYPCGIPGDKKLEKGFDSTKVINGPGMISKCTPPCPPPPGDTCTPYQVWHSYDNYYEALFFFADNPSVRSSSNAILKSTTDTIATCEDFFIKIKPGYTINDFSSLISYYSLTSSDVSADFGAGVYKISESVGGSRFCIERADIFFETGKCDFSVPNFYGGSSELTNDPLWNEQWGLLNTGQYNGQVGADIRVEPAWAFTRGNNINVAVIDVGIQLDHPDLQANLLPGYDAFNNITGGGGPISVNDIHGTQCAGIIGAIADNNIGVAGVAPECSIIPIRAFSDDRNEHSNEAYGRAINWAWRNGADVISNSWRTSFQSDLIDQAINDAITLGRGNNGSVVVFAAGNGASAGLEYPAKLDDVIAVGNMSMCNSRVNPNSCDNEHGASSYGIELDMTAPGVKIPTLILGGGTTTSFKGTSASCPHVAGVAALVLSANPNLTQSEVKRILQYSCNKVGAYCYNWTSAHPDGPWNNEMGYGRINAFNAVQLALRATSFSSPQYNIPQQNNSLVSNNIQLIVLSPGCSALTSTVYYVQRYEVTTNIAFPFTNNPLIICNSNGWSAANPNDGKNFAAAINVTNTSATLKSWVYKGYNSIGQFVGWFPTTPENVKFNYSIIGANNSINYQTFRSATTSLNIPLTGAIPFEFDSPGKVNDISLDMDLNNNKIKVFPNPVTNIFYLTTDFPKDEFIISTVIIDNTGRDYKHIWMNTKMNFASSIDVSNLKPGFYVLRIITNNKMYSKKIIKQ